MRTLSYPNLVSALSAIAIAVTNRFKSRRWLEAEHLLLRYQLNIALRRAQKFRLTQSIAQGQ